MIKLDRREILESLIRQGVHGIDRLKRDCRQYERYWEARCRGFLQGIHRRNHNDEIGLLSRV